MTQFEELESDHQAIFDDLIEKLKYDNVVEFKLLSNAKLKEIGKVVKANDITKYLSGNDVIIIINEKIFEQLEPKQQLMVAEELLARVAYDFENDKLVFIQPDINTYSGLLQKYGYDDYAVLKESIKSLFESEKEEAAAANA